MEPINPGIEPQHVEAITEQQSAEDINNMSDERVAELGHEIGNLATFGLPENATPDQVQAAILSAMTKHIAPGDKTEK